MICSKLINSLAIVFMLEFAGMAMADDELAADEQSADDEVQAKSGTVIATHVASNTDELARSLANPVSSLISVTLQYNYARTFNDDGYRNLLNIQPVVPMSISKNWNLISRSIMPVVFQKIEDAYDD